MYETREAVGGETWEVTWVPGLPYTLGRPWLIEILPEGIVNEVVDLDYNEEMFEEENALGDL